MLKVWNILLQVNENQKFPQNHMEYIYKIVYESWILY